MKLFGLKDENGQEYKLVLNGKTGQWEAEPVTHEPEFKFELGKWYVGDNADVFYCDAISEGWAWSRDKKCQYNPNYSRHATPQEIEQHLCKICDEKYVGKRVVSLFGLGAYNVNNKKHMNPFNFSRDQYWMTDGMTGVLVYEKGKFAEIVPDKKPLPKNKEEFKIFMTNWAERWLISPPTHDKCVNDFLKDYED